VPPAGLASFAGIYVPLSIVTALAVLADIFVLGRRQPMAIMDAVWPLTMLYWGPLGLIFYAWFGRAVAGGAEHHEHPPHGHAGGSMWQATFKGATHCGAGCALGDFIGDWIVVASGFALFCSSLGARYLVGFVLAYLFGIAFQYASVASMQGLGLRDGLVAAVKIDTLSLLAYQIGMFAMMAVSSALFPALRPTQWSYWFMMQVAMVAGFATTYPINWWLIASGIKEKM
jgi:hypothetical protein